MAGTQTGELGKLRRRSRKVQCPACQKTGKTIRIREAWRAPEMVSTIWFCLCTAGAYWLLTLRTPGGTWLAHYCSNCGVRLLLYTLYGRRFYLDTEQLQRLSPASLSPELAPELAPVPGLVARSPYRTDDRLVQNTKFKQWKYRYSKQQPTEILVVDTDGSGPNDVPKSLWNADRSQKLYQVSFPDSEISPAGKFGANMFWRHLRNDAIVIPLTYTLANASICVSSALAPKNAKVYSLIQLAQQNWDVAFYFPRETERYQTQVQHMPAPIAFEALDPSFPWMSCAGEMMWTTRTATDARDGCAARRQLVLLDAYDRLVAMRGYGSGAAELRLYGDFSAELTLEIVTSFVAFDVQCKRLSDWNNIRQYHKPVFSVRDE